MGSGISPVLASFLAGQNQQVDLLKTAQEIMSRQQNNQNQIEERKQKQQDLDDVMKRFGISSKQEQARIDLEHEHASNEVKLHLMNAEQQLRSNLASGLQKPQQSPTGVVNPMQSQDTPMGSINVQMPQTTLQNTLQQRAALDPLDIEKKKQEDEALANSKIPALQNTIDQKDRALANQRDIADLKAEVMRQGYEGRLSQAELRARQTASDHMMQWGIPEDPEAARQMLAGYIHQQASGQGSGNPRQEYGPVIGAKVEAGLSASGFRTPPKGLRDSVMGTANDASKFLNTIDNIKNTTKAPTTLTGQVSNVLADKFGIQGLSPYKSQFDALTTEIVPSLDTAIGLTPGTLARSPKLYDKLKSLAPLPGDKPDVVAKKEADGVDIYLSGISKKLAGLPAQQRATFWQDIANDHPELVNRNSGIRAKLFKAGNTGTYEPGDLYKTFGGK